MRDEGVEYVVMEVSSHALALGKLAPITFEAAIFTNLTPEHLDFHKTMEAYAAAKAKLFGKTRLAICNADSPYCERMLKEVACRKLTALYGRRNIAMQHGKTLFIGFIERCHVQFLCAVENSDFLRIVN